jgi:hypothetical protein
MCEQQEFKAPGRSECAAAGAQCPLLTAEMRNHLQTCLVSVELLTSLDLPPQACNCAERHGRALESLIRCLVAETMRQDFDPDLETTGQGADAPRRQ